MTDSATVPAFDSALAASQQVAETVKSMRQKLANTLAEIRMREEEIQQHQAAPLPESDLVNFFSQYVDAMAEKGKQSILSRLADMLYPARYGVTEIKQDRLPISFAEVSQVVDPSCSNWLTESLPYVLDFRQLGGSFHNHAEMSFFFKDQIKERLSSIMADAPVKYQRSEAVGLPMATRRARIAVLTDELAGLNSQRLEIEGNIRLLQGGLL